MVEPEEIEPDIRLLVSDILQDAKTRANGVLPKTQVFQVTETGYSAPYVENAKATIGLRSSDKAFDHRASALFLQCSGKTYPSFVTTPTIFSFSAQVCARSDWTVDESAWAEAWPALSAFLKTRSLFARWSCPVVGVDIREPYELAGGLHFRPLSLSERGDLAAGPFKGDYVATTVLEAQCVVPHDTPINHPETVQALLDVQTAIWIEHGSNVGFGVIRFSTALQGGTAYMGSNTATLGRQRDRPEAFDCESFGSFWKEARRAFLDRPKRLDPALQRFRQMHEQPRLGDRLLDQIIILESLLLQDDTRELSYRLGLRVAHLLGKDHLERRKIFDVIRDAYKLRSKVAHGGDVKKSSSAIPGAIDSYVRSTLRLFLVRYADPTVRGRVAEVLQNELDDLVFEQSSDPPPTTS